MSYPFADIISRRPIFIHEADSQPKCKDYFLLIMRAVLKKGRPCWRKGKDANNTWRGLEGSQMARWTPTRPLQLLMKARAFGPLRQQRNLFLTSFSTLAIILCDGKFNHVSFFVSRIDRQSNSFSGIDRLSLLLIPNTCSPWIIL